MSNVFGETTTAVREVATSSPKVFYFIIIVLILAVGGIAYWYFKPKARDVTKMGPFVLTNVGIGNGNTTKTIFTQDEIENSLGNNFTLSFFVYMQGVNRENIPIGGPKGDFRFKPLVYILGVGDILLDPIHQMARIRIRPLANDGTNKTQDGGHLDIENFMVARWNQLTLTIEGRTVDVYMNGALVTSTLLENLPILKPMGILLETSPDFSGQAGLFQAWPSRETERKIAYNYKRNTDTRGKPLIPDTPFNWRDAWEELKKSLCKAGFCDFRMDTGPLEYVDYEYA